MSLDRKRTETLFALICELVEAGREEFLPGDLSALLQQRNQPMGTWMVRREFSILESLELIVMDPASGIWKRTGRTLQTAHE